MGGLGPGPPGPPLKSGPVIYFNFDISIAAVMSAAAPADRKPNGRHLKQFTVINYGRSDATDRDVDDVDNQDDVVDMEPRRSATQLRHGHGLPPRLSSPHRSHPAERGPRGQCWVKYFSKVF